MRHSKAWPLHLISDCLSGMGLPAATWKERESAEEPKACGILFHLQLPRDEIHTGNGLRSE